MLIIRTRTRCNADLLEGSRCRFIGTATIGFDHIDTEYCRRHAIEWVNAPGCNAASVAQYITASLLRHAEKQAIDLRTKCIGIVGVGHVGRQVEIHCRRLGMQVLLNDPPRAEKEGKGEFVSLEEIADRCDYISFHTPLIKEGSYATYHWPTKFSLTGCSVVPSFSTPLGEVSSTSKPFWKLTVITL